MGGGGGYIVEGGACYGSNMGVCLLSSFIILSMRYVRNFIA